MREERTIIQSRKMACFGLLSMLVGVTVIAHIRPGRNHWSQTREIIHKYLGTTAPRHDDALTKSENDFDYHFHNFESDDEYQSAVERILEGAEDEDHRDADREEHDINGLEFDDQVYIDDDYVDDYYAFKDDPGRSRLIPLQTSDIFGFLFACMGTTLAAGGGIGGGGIVVPVYILVMGLSPRDAIPIASVTVFGGASAALCINAHKRHPLADRPLIDWNLVLVMEPLVLTGAIVGNILHRILSQKLLVVLLVAMLSVTAHTTLSKARRMYAAETVYIEKLKQFHQDNTPPPWRNARYGMPPAPESTPDADAAGDKSKANNSRDSAEKKKANRGRLAERLGDEVEIEGQEMQSKFIPQEIMILNPDFVSLRSDMLEEEKVTPKEKIIALCSMFSIIIFLNIMVGGGRFYSPWGIRCGGVAFWVVHVIMTGFLVASAWAAQTYLVNRHEIKQLVSFDYVHGDIQWDKRGAVRYPLVFFASGVFAGVFGIGGGMIVVPLLLTMGVHPQVATATSSCMILFTSFSSVISFAVFDVILWDYAAVCLMVGFFPTLFGQLLMGKVRKADGTFERNSIIAFSIGGVILLSSLLMTIQYVFEIVKFKSQGDDGGVCEGYGRGV